MVSNKKLTRSYALWSSLRLLGSAGHFPTSDVVKLAQAKTGKAQSTIYNWLEAGDGIFWNRNHGQLYLIGKGAVFDHFLGHGVKPGLVFLVSEENILAPKLHTLRAYLSATWNTRGRVTARIIRRNIFQGIPERTQQNYDKTAGVFIRPISVRNGNAKKQLSNYYGMSPNVSTLTVQKRQDGEFFGHRAIDFNAAVRAKALGFNSNHCVENNTTFTNGIQQKNHTARRYFDNQHKAVEVARYRKQHDIPIPVYWLNPDDNRRDYGSAKFAT